jgi:hypothetical protein
MVCVCVLVCVERPQKIRKRAKLSMIPSRALRKPPLPLSKCVIFWQRGPSLKLDFVSVLDATC